MREQAVDLALSALADSTRRHAVELLGARPYRAGELAKALDVPLPAMSRHLKALKAADLVSERFDDFDARVRIYSLESAGFETVRQWLAATDDLWAAQMAAFKRHVEGGA